VELLKYVRPGPYLPNSQDFTQPRSYLDRGLMRNNMSQFVSENAGQFVVTFRHSHHLACYVDSATRDAERIHLGKLHQVETELQLGWRQMLNQSVSNSPQVGIELIVIDNIDLARQAFRHDVAQVDFLLVGKNIQFARNRLNGGWHRAVLSRRQRDSQYREHKPSDRELRSAAEFPSRCRIRRSVGHPLLL